MIFFRWHIGVARYAACSANPFIRFVDNLPFVFVKYHILLYPFIAFIHTVSISGKPVSLFYTAGPLSSPGHSCCHRPLVLSDAKVGSRACSVGLKCISCKILPFRERVIWQEKPPYEAVPTAGTCIHKTPKAVRQKRTDKRENKKTSY